MQSHHFNSSTATPRVLIMAGGTGGHILPALAIAQALQAAGADIHWLGTPRGLETQIITPTGIPLHYIQMQGIRGKGVLDLLAAPWRMLHATLQAHRIIRQLNAALVMGFGGFVSAPGGLAAWLARKPLVLHEQNAIAGMTNRCLSRLATRVFQAFPHTFPASLHAVTCGNPVRADILALPTPELRFKHREGPLRILVLGGSQGAASLNQLLPDVIARFPAEQRPHVWHSTGKQAVEKTQEHYRQLGVDARVVAFIDTMPEAYAWADVVICRAGASTIAELAAAGVGSILVPFPQAVDDHQTKNARYLVSSNAALLIQQNSLNAAKLYGILTELITDRARLLEMAVKARELATTDTTQLITTYCLQLLKTTAKTDMNG